MKERKTDVRRRTRETSIVLSLGLDGEGRARIATGLGFLDHVLEALARHGRFDLDLTCAGDLEVDDHHSAEDCARVLGAAFDESLGERRGVARFGHAYAPLDEALARAVVDLSGRPFAAGRLGLERETLGAIAAENLEHVLRSLAVAGRMTLHVEVLAGENDHHRAEAAFKAVGLALRQAVAITQYDDVPSTKGVLS